MALQTSGQIKISEIRTELGSTSNSLRTLSAAAGFSTPDAMSEFYGYSSAPPFTPSTLYWRGDGVNDTLRLEGVPIGGWDTTQGLSWSGWYRLESGGGAVEQLGSISENAPNGSNQVFLQFDGRYNRIYHRVRINGTFCQRQYPLHDNLAITGVSSAGWSASNSGNTNADGFVHLVFTWNPSDTTSNAIQVYWNGQQLTSSVNNQSGIRQPWVGGSMAVADLVSSVPYNANVFQGSVDNIAIWGRVITQAEITAMYNGGVPIQYDEAGVIPNIIAEYRFEGDFADATNQLPELQNLNGGTLQPY